MNKEVFDKEINLCKRLSKENKGKCAWGICKNCGVVPFLYKIYKGKLLEKAAEIKRIKSKIIKT